MYGLILAALVQPQAPTPPQAPPVQITYEDAHGQALTEGLRLAVFVGVPARKIEGIVTVSVPWEGHWKRYGNKSVIVFGQLRGYPRDLYKMGEFSPTATDDEIRAGKRAEVSQEAIPFETVRREERDDAKPVGWPKGLIYPGGLERYERARLTQRTFDRALSGVIGRAVIESVSREVLEAKWHAPGGVVGIEGVTSELYRGVNNRSRNWRGPIEPILYSENTYQRSYEDGAVFADVLSYQGKVFAVRYAVKENGVWDRFTAYRKVAAEPPGYKQPASAECRACHAQAGATVYATASILGGDGILSEPLQGVE